MASRYLDIKNLLTLSHFFKDHIKKKGLFLYLRGNFLRRSYSTENDDLTHSLQKTLSEY